MSELEPARIDERPHGLPRRVAGYAMGALAWVSFVLGLALNAKSPLGVLLRDPIALLVGGWSLLFSFASIGKPGWPMTTRDWLVGWLKVVASLGITLAAATALDGLVPDSEGPSGAALVLAWVLVMASALALGHPRRPPAAALRKGIAYAAILVAVFAAGLVMVVVSGYGEPRQLLVTVPVAAGAAILAVVLLRRNAAEARAAAGAHPPDPA